MAEVDDWKPVAPAKAADDDWAPVGKSAAGPNVAVTGGEKQFEEDKRIVEQASGLAPGELKAATYSGLNAFLLNAPSHVVAAYTSYKEGKPYEEAFKEQKRYEEALERQYPKSSMVGTGLGIGAGLAVPMGAVGTAGRLLEAGTAAKLAGTAAPEVIKAAAPTAARLLPAAGTAGAMTGTATALEKPVTDIDVGSALKSAAIGAGIGAGAELAIPALTKYFSKFPDSLDAAGNLKPEAMTAVKKAFPNMEPETIKSFQDEIASVFRSKGPSEAAAVEALALKEGAPSSRAIATGQRPKPEAADIASKNILDVRDVVGARKAELAGEPLAPTVGAESVHKAYKTGKEGYKEAYETVGAAKGTFEPETFDYFMPAIEKELLKNKAPVSFEGTQKLFPQSAEAMKYIQQGIASGNLPNANQPFNFGNLELVRKTLNQFAKEAYNKGNVADARNIEFMKEGLFKGTQKAIDDNLFSGNGNQVIRDLNKARDLFSDFKNKFYDYAGPSGGDFRKLVKGMVDDTTNKIGENLPEASALAAQRAIDTGLLNKKGGLAFYDRLGRVLGPNSTEMKAINDQIRSSVFNTGGDTKKVSTSIDEFLKFNGPIAERVFTGKDGNPSIADLRRLSELSKKLDRVSAMPNEQKDSLLVSGAQKINSLLASLLVGNIHGMFAGTAAFLGADILQSVGRKGVGAYRRGVEEFGAPLAETKVPEALRLLEKPMAPTAPVRNIEPMMQEAEQQPGYQPATPLGGRPGRRAGGRVGNLSDKLVTAVDRAKKNINNDTKVLLNADDNHVAKALEVANRHLEG